MASGNSAPTVQVVHRAGVRELEQALARKRFSESCTEKLVASVIGAVAIAQAGGGIQAAAIASAIEAWSMRTAPAHAAGSSSLPFLTLLDAPPEAVAFLSGAVSAAGPGGLH